MKLKIKEGEKEKHRRAHADENDDPQCSRFKMYDEVEDLAKPYIPKNTQLNTQRAMKNLKALFDGHTNSGSEVLAAQLTPDCSAEELNQWLPA